MKINEMKRETKRRIYALALASIMFVLPKTRAFAEDVDMSSKVDIDKAISELVPDDTPTVKPAEPVKPTNPVTPTEPTNGTEPTNPVTPTEPTKGTEPTNPVNPTEPSVPAETTVPTEPTNGIDDENKNNSQKKCDHVWGAADDVTDQKAPSCTTDGHYTEIFHCKKCGQEKRVSHTISAPGHKWDGGTREGNKIIYRCQNKGCYEEYVKTPDPTEPTKGTEPTTPTTPVTPTKPGKPTDVPKTGDNSMISQVLAGVVLASTAAFTLAGTAIYKVRKESEIAEPVVDDNYKGKFLSKR